MPLIPCPECQKQISSAAEACPSCGLPNPARDKGECAPASAPAALPKEDVSCQFPLVSIEAKDSFEATHLISQHLNRIRAAGWDIGGAVARGGINEYKIESAKQKATLRFDLRPTLQLGVPRSLIATHTLMAGIPGLTEEKINELKRRNLETMRLLYPQQKPGWMIFLLLLGFGVFVFLASLLYFTRLR